jgi:hypothetical protein
MVTMSRLALTGGGVALAILAATGCQQGPGAASQARADTLTRMATERDRLVQEVSEDARMMSEISADLAKVRIPSKQLHVSSESPLGAQRDSVVQEIHYVAARVTESERKLRDSERRIHDLTTLSDSLRSTLEATIANFDSTIAQQKTTIAALTDQVNQLTAQNVALTDTVGQLKEQNNTVYYIIGTRDELLQRGIVVQEGGSRFPLIFTKLGRILVPARRLDPKDFTPINKRVVTEIPLPGANRSYRIASRQDLEGLAVPTPDGHVSGSVKIANPDKFWSGSRFLILVEG